MMAGLLLGAPRTMATADPAQILATLVLRRSCQGLNAHCAPGTVAGVTVTDVLSNPRAPVGAALPNFTGEAAESPEVGSLSSRVVFCAPTACSGHDTSSRERTR